MRGPRSLQLRLALLVGVSVTLIWVGGATLTARTLRHEMNEVFDTALIDAAQRLLPLIARNTHPRREPGPRPPRPHDRDDAVSFVVRDRAGQVLARGGDATTLPPPYEQDGFRDSKTDRLYYDSARDGALTITVSEPLHHRAEVAREIQMRMMMPLLVMIPLSLLAIFFAVRTSLAPVRQLRQDLAARGPRHLGPLTDTGLPSELMPIASGVNQLLARLKAAFDAERSFAANAAHELRTPVAGAIAQAQRLRSETDDAQAAQRAQDIETTLKRLNSLSVKLMQLARAEGSRLRGDRQTDMRPILQIILDDFQRAGAQARITTTLPAHAVLSDLDPDAFGILCRNLIENALRHGAADTPVHITLTQQGTLRVANDGAHLTPDQIAHLTTRFAQGDSTGQGSGLGLAIVQTIAERSGGTLDFASPAPGFDGGLEVRFALPDQTNT